MTEILISTDGSLSTDASEPTQVALANAGSSFVDPAFATTNTSSAFYLSTKSINVKNDGKVVFGIQNNGTGEWLQNSSGTPGANPNDFGIAFFGNSKEFMRMTNAGLFGIGTTSPAKTLDVHGDSQITGDTQIQGKLSIGSDTGTDSLNVDGDCTISGNVTLSGLQNQGLASATDVTVDKNGNLGVLTSSARFKEDIGDADLATAALLGLRPKTFRYKDQDEQNLGYIAEDLHEQGLKELVAYDNDGLPYAVQYKLMPIYLLELVKQQQDQIQALHDQLSELRSRVDNASGSSG